MCEYDGVETWRLGIHPTSRRFDEARAEVFDSRWRRQVACLGIDQLIFCRVTDEINQGEKSWIRKVWNDGDDLSTSSG